MGSPSDELTLVREDSIEDVPRYLFTDSADEWMTENVVNRLYEYNFAYAQDPSVMIYVMRDPDNKPQGVLWLQADPILNAINGRFVGVTEPYRDRTIVEKVTEFMQNIAYLHGYSKILAASQKDTSFWQSLGWREMRTKTLIQEI